jgi:hypothetical protein
MCLCFVFCVLTLFLQGAKPLHTFSAVGQGALGDRVPCAVGQGALGDIVPQKIEMFCDGKIGCSSQTNNKQQTNNACSHQVSRIQESSNQPRIYHGR